MIERKVGFISLCFARTEKMNKNESLKYFRYGNIISAELNNYFAGKIIEQPINLLLNYKPKWQEITPSTQ